MSKEPIEIQEYTASWEGEFLHIGKALRRALGETALRIDHIGSTSILGLAAKPIIDVQVSVAALEPMVFLVPIESLGYVWRRDNPVKTKRYFREQAGTRRTHIHVRKSGGWHEQYALLFRDYVRTHHDAAKRYEQIKRNLASRFRNERGRYTEGKTAISWEIMRIADRWAAESGWEPGPPDA